MSAVTGERNETESLVHMKLTVGDDDMGMAHDLEDVSGDMKDLKLLYGEDMS